MAVESPVFPRFEPAAPVAEIAQRLWAAFASGVGPEFRIAEPCFERGKKRFEAAVVASGPAIVNDETYHCCQIAGRRAMAYAILEDADEITVEIYDRAVAEVWQRARVARRFGRRAADGSGALCGEG